VKGHCVGAVLFSFTAICVVASDIGTAMSMLDALREVKLVEFGGSQEFNCWLGACEGNNVNEWSGVKLVGPNPFIASTN
jgi:hypothetical protein